MATIAALLDAMRVPIPTFCGFFAACADLERVVDALEAVLLRDVLARLPETAGLVFETGLRAAGARLVGALAEALDAALRRFG